MGCYYNWQVDSMTEHLLGIIRAMDDYETFVPQICVALEAARDVLAREKHERYLSQQRIIPPAPSVRDNA